MLSLEKQNEKLKGVLEQISGMACSQCIHSYPHCEDDCGNSTRILVKNTLKECKDS